MQSSSVVLTTPMNEVDLVCVYLQLLHSSEGEQKFPDSLNHLQLIIIDHFTVVCSVTRPLNGSEAGGDLVLIQTSLLLLCKSSCSNAN